MFERTIQQIELEDAVQAYAQEAEHAEVWRELAEQDQADTRDTLESANRCIDRARAKGIDRLCTDCGHPLSNSHRTCPRCKRPVCIGCGE